jgi:hypothetical protein
MPSVDEPGRAGPSRPGRTVGTVQRPLRVSRHPCVEWVLETVLHGTRSPWPLSIEPTRAAAEAARTLWHSARRTRLRHCSRDPSGKCRHSAEIEPPRMLGAGGEGVGGQCTELGEGARAANERLPVVGSRDRIGVAMPKALGALRARRLRTTRGIAEVDRRCLHSVRLIWSD